MAIDGMWHIVPLLLLTLWICLGENVTVSGQTTAANPVLLFHGLMDNHKTMEYMAFKIKKDFPGTYTHSIKLYPDDYSLISLKVQSESLVKYIKNLHIEGPITFIGHSMGALSGRNVIQNWDDHNITTFISLAGPHMGVSKVPPINGIAGGYENFINDTLAYMCYNAGGQEFSLCNFWNDPTKQAMYKKRNKFLSSSLCQTQRKKCPGQSDNLKKLQKMVLIGGPQDGTVFPFESTLFGYYDNEWNIVPRRDQSFYKDLGLKKMDKNNRIVECIKESVEHVQFVFNDDVYNDCVRPHIV
ncbi:lysosomal thioesterase PPT2-A-like [Bolinopsis microptera]|uniref:lysosomal thioesterase PPT2-A-like n=1 Tax=Bolinopsis microptera TaxID=2820187 RepID=UPI00307A4D7B